MDNRETKEELAKVIALVDEGVITGEMLRELRYKAGLALSSSAALPTEQWVDQPRPSSLVETSPYADAASVRRPRQSLPQQASCDSKRTVIELDTDEIKRMTAKIVAKRVPGSEETGVSIDVQTLVAASTSSPRPTSAT